MQRKLSYYLAEVTLYHDKRDEKITRTLKIPEKYKPNVIYKELQKELEGTFLHVLDVNVCVEQVTKELQKLPAILTANIYSFL